jgi:transposase
MISVEDRERVRRAYFIEHKTQRQIAKELQIARKTVRKAIECSGSEGYTLSAPRPAPVLDPYKARIEFLLRESEKMPRKQRYTGRKIFQLMQQAGYTGAESTVRAYIGRLRQAQKRPKVYLPLEFDPGEDAQMDWGEAVAVIAGVTVTVQLFFMRLCYSRRLFVMAFPCQKQEAFFAGHVAAFNFFGGVPRRLSYDNLTTAVEAVLQGKNRREQQAFVVFRSHYLFASHFCTPGEGHEKGGIEHGVGFGRRNYLVPIPQVASFAELNEFLLAQCQADDLRQVDGQTVTIGEAWALEQPSLLPLPAQPFRCCVTRPVCLTPYSQVEFETNRYSVPADKAQRNLVLRAYPFVVEILYQDEVLASHVRSYERDQDIFDPLHYLPLLAQRPGAFAHAKPLRWWRSGWPSTYEQLLERLQSESVDGQAIREFVRILALHQQYPASAVEAAIAQALVYGCIHADGVELCLRQHLTPEVSLPPLDLAGHPRLLAFAAQDSGLNLHTYERLLQQPTRGATLSV